MDNKHRSVIIPNENRPIIINTTTTRTQATITPPLEQPQQQQSPTIKSVLKKANVIINTTFLNDIQPKVYKNALRPRSAAPRVAMQLKSGNNSEQQSKLFHISNSTNTNGHSVNINYQQQQQQHEQNENYEPRTRPNTAKSTYSHGRAGSAHSTYSSINNVTLTLDIPNKQPTLLERYWKYNKIKKGEVLTNRCFDSDDGRLYVLCTESYLQNAPKLIRQRPKSGVRFSTAVTFSNFDESKTLNVDSDTTSEASVSNYYPSSPSKSTIIKSEKNDLLTMRSSLKSAQQKRRCVSATPRLGRNLTTTTTIKENNTTTSNNETKEPVNISNTIDEHKIDSSRSSSNSNSTRMHNNHNSINIPREESKSSCNDSDSNSEQGNKNALRILRDDVVDSEFDEKVSQLLKEKSNKDRKLQNGGDSPRINSTIRNSHSRPITSEAAKFRPKSSVSVASIMTNESTSKKYYSVSQFNKFKNKLIDRKIYNQKQYENLDHVYNDWLNKPIPQDKKYIAGKYSVEMKRINYANYIKKRQVFLAESLCIKKINVNVQ